MEKGHRSERGETVATKSKHGGFSEVARFWPGSLQECHTRCGWSWSLGNRAGSGGWRGTPSSQEAACLFSPRRWFCMWDTEDCHPGVETDKYNGLVDTLRWQWHLLLVIISSLKETVSSHAGVSLRCPLQNKNTLPWYLKPTCILKLH